MALNKDIIFNGLPVSNAYIRIDTVNGCKGDLQISVNSYVSKELYSNGSGYLEQKFYNFAPSVDDDAPNFIKQGYNYLKTLNEYAGAVDC